jgi:mycothiol synthase
MAATQLQMVYEQMQLLLPDPLLPHGYSLRLYRAGDEVRFSTVMMRAGFGDWDTARIRPWMARILPDGWFMVVDDLSQVIVATAMCLHDHSDDHPFGGEVGWVAVDPDHRGKHLGSIVTAACVRRFIAAGYHNIHLYTEDFRLPAIKTYLRLGFRPFLYAQDMPERWREVCAALAWEYTPHNWRTAPGIRID